jgi:transposase
MLNMHKIFITEHEGKRGWGSIDEGIILKGILHKLYEDVHWINLAEVRIQWLASMTIIIKLRAQ